MLCASVFGVVWFNELYLNELLPVLQTLCKTVHTSGHFASFFFFTFIVVLTIGGLALGLLKLRSLIYPLGTFSKKYQPKSLNYIHIWQVSPQLRYQHDIQQVTGILMILKNLENNEMGEISLGVNSRNKSIEM